MNVHRSLTVGVVSALLAGGCAAHPNATPASHPASGSGNTPMEARNTASPADIQATPQQVADRTANLAKKLDPGAADPSSPAPEHVGKSASSVQFTVPSTDASPAPTAVAQAPVQPTPRATATIDPRAALLAKAVQSGPLSPDAPIMIPEGTELTTSIHAVDPLGVRLAKRAKACPQDPGAQFDYQVYLLLNGSGDGAEPLLQSSVGLPPDVRDTIGAIIDGISNFRSAVTADPNLAPTQMGRPMQDMADRLRSGSDLALTNLALCKRVNGFGLYDPITPARFPMGRSSQFFLYCEVDNFLPRHMPDGQWQTNLKQRVALLTAGGTQVWPDGSPDDGKGVFNLCRTRRRDFFTREPITLPATLAPGSYQLQVTITDVNANKVAQSNVPLWIGGN